MENSVQPDETAGAPPKTGFEAFAERVEKVFSRRRATTPRRSIAERIEPGDTRTVEKHFRELAYVTNLVGWLKFSVAVVLFLVAVIWAGVVVAKLKPIGMVRAQPGLQDAVREAMVAHMPLSRDPLDHFAVSSIVMMKQVDSSGAPLLPMLQGLVAPPVYQRAVDSVARNIDNIRRLVQSQSFVFGDILQFVPPDDTGVAAIWVRGKLRITQGLGERAPVYRDHDYVAKLYVSRNLPSAANHQHFYLEDIEEWVGPKALALATELQR